MKNKLYFVDARTGEKDGRKWSIISLSDGQRTATTSNPNFLDTSTLKEGDEVKTAFTVTINFRNEFNVELVSISKA